MSLGVARANCLRSYDELVVRRKTRRYVGWLELPDENVSSRCASRGDIMGASFPMCLPSTNGRWGYRRRRRDSLHRPGVARYWCRHR